MSIRTASQSNSGGEEGLYAGTSNGGRTIGRGLDEKVGLRTSNEITDDDNIDRLPHSMLYGLSIKVEYGYEGEEEVDANGTS
jgi:hypothetical protein